MPTRVPLDQIAAVFAEVKGQSVPITALRYAKTTSKLFEGRRVPMVFIDTRERPDVARLIKTHREVGQGAIMSRWGLFAQSAMSMDGLMISLGIRFTKPEACEFTLLFPTSKASTRKWLTTADSLRGMSISNERPFPSGNKGIVAEIGSSPLSELLVGAFGIITVAEQWHW